MFIGGWESEDKQHGKCDDGLREKGTKMKKVTRRERCGVWGRGIQNDIFFHSKCSFIGDL